MTESLRRVVLGVDFSEASRDAEETAIALCRQQGASLSLVHALEVASFSLGFSRLPHQVYQEIHELAEQRLEELAQRLAETADVEVDWRLLEGHAHRALIEQARELDADLIVLGTRGLTGWRGMLLGSTARRVIQHATRPVLTVPVRSEGEEPRAWAPIESVLIPTDFSEDARLAARIARRLCLGASAPRIHLLNVYATPLLQTSYGTVPTTLHYLDDFKGEALRELDKKAGTLADGVTIETHAIEGYPPEVIVDQAAELGVGLVAMGTRGSGALAHLLVGSTAEKVLEHSPCPVLTVNRREIDLESVDPDAG